MIDFILFGGFDFTQTDERTFGVVELLSRLKISPSIIYQAAKRANTQCLLSGGSLLRFVHHFPQVESARLD